ncbi:hypothetical protein [Microbispora hainanensis]|uniref:Uncharacterized protein n=1 Tax=Microbispora hainanensis TaxID=568844 RepID=A0A544YT71_9ACTN|nr:hypothetical protein [Microbispora hainanensis]TQS19975.1 hypothetical protein FLX08_18245 [Microbispora hainanensis]
MSIDGKAAYASLAGVPPLVGRAVRAARQAGFALVVDDLTPARHWPPRFGGGGVQARTHWLGHPGLDAAELRLAPDLAALVATRRFRETPGAADQ